MGQFTSSSPLLVWGVSKKEMLVALMGQFTSSSPLLVWGVSKKVMLVALMGQFTSSSPLLVLKTTSWAPQFSPKLAKVTPLKLRIPLMAGLVPAAPTMGFHHGRVLLP